MSATSAQPLEKLRPPIGTVAAVLLLILHFVLAYWLGWLEHVRKDALNDFATYIAAARAHVAGVNPYDPAILAQHSPIPPEYPLFPFVYPAPFLGLFAWVTAVAPNDAYAMWFVVNEVMTLIGVACLARACGPRIPAWAWCLALACSAAVPNQLTAGQGNGLLLAILGLACWSAQSGRIHTAGALLGLSFAIKPMLVPALLVLALGRRSLSMVVSAILAYGLAHVAFVVLHGWPGSDGFQSAVDLVVRFHTDILKTLPSGGFLEQSMGLDRFANQSVKSLLVHHVPATQGGATLLILSLIPASALLLVAIRPRSEDRDAAHVIGSALAPLLVASYLFAHHLIFALPALAFAAATLVQPDGEHSAGRIVRRALAFLALVLSAIDIYWLRHLWSTSSPPWSEWLYDLKTAYLFVLLALLLGMRSREVSSSSK